jgi:hypothetical protein
MNGITTKSKCPSRPYANRIKANGKTIKCIRCISRERLRVISFRKGNIPVYPIVIFLAVISILYFEVKESIKSRILRPYVCCMLWPGFVVLYKHDGTSNEMEMMVDVPSLVVIFAAEVYNFSSVKEY